MNHTLNHTVRTDSPTPAAALDPNSADLRPGAGTTPAPRTRQLTVLAGAEWRELLRNKVALINSFALPLVTGLIVFAISPDARSLGVYFPVMVTGTAILFVVYYTLVTAVVARRESLLLKRLRSGEAEDATILSGIALPFVAVTFVQFLISVVLARLLFDVQLGGLTVVAGLAVVLTTVVFAALALASTAVTRTVEHAQITTLPIIMVPLVLSGMMFPLSVMPDAMRTVAQLMPLTPVMELLHLGMGGVTVDGQAVGLAEGLTHAGRPLLVLVGWIVFGLWATRRAMVWEPRS